MSVYTTLSRRTVFAVVLNYLPTFAVGLKFFQQPQKNKFLDETATFWRDFFHIPVKSVQIQCETQ